MAASAVGALLTLCALGLLAFAATSPRIASPPSVPASAPLVQAEPPAPAVTLASLAPQALDARAQPAPGCASARRMLRFEMITTDPQTDPVMVPRARVCLAVYRK